MKLPETCYKETAEKLNLPLNLVKAVNRYYWKEGIKKNLSNVEHTSLFLKNIGTIVISNYKIRKEIITVINKMRRVKNSKRYTDFKKTVILENYTITLRKLLKKRNEVIKHGNN